MKKRILCAGLAAVMLLSLSGCSMLPQHRMLLQMGKNLLQEDDGPTDGGDASDGQMPRRETEMDVFVGVDEFYTSDVEMEVWEDGAVSFAAGFAPEMAPVNWNTEEYSYNEENGWMSTVTSPFSTFAADVDTASYANVRRMLLQGQEVPKDAVRIEEMINYFHYDYAAPEDGDMFGMTARIAPCPWNEQTQLMLVGLKAKEVKAQERAKSNLVFLIDVSGSMDEYNKLPLVQRAFRLLIDELDAGDTVSIVTYANEDTVVLEGADGEEKTRICDAIEDLSPAGGTNGSQGIVAAYRIAEEHFIEGGNNRVILATDGDLNIGMTDEGSLTRLIQEKAKSGVFLSVLGFGQGNISDTNMEALADHGNGNYSYIDNISEARRVLVDEAGGTLFTVAKDVKLQVEFNQAMVKGYRLIGYENRTMSAESFADDTKDGGEIGSGHTVTALYEIASVDSAFEVPAVISKYTQAENAEGTGTFDREWATVHVRYKEPDEEESTLLDLVVDEDAVEKTMDDDLSWAAGVAQAGMLLSDSEYAGNTDIKEVRERLKPLAADDEFREEFLYMLSKM